MVADWAVWGLLGTALFGLAWRGRKRRADALRHPVRRNLLEVIQRNPGLQAEALRDAVEANRGTINYHLLFLERIGEVRVVRREHTTRYFPGETDQRTSEQLAVLLQGRIMEVVDAILKTPGVSQKELTRTLPMSRKVFRRYANLLYGQHLVEEVRAKRLKKYYPTPDLLGLLRQDRKPRGPNGDPKEGPS